MEIKHDLLEIFNSFLLKNPITPQKEIADKGFVYSELDYSSDVLFCGINPSLRTDFLKTNNSYNYKLVCQTDRYFKKFEQFKEGFNKELNFSYFDIFYQRHSQQIEIENFMKNGVGRKFLQEQLILTKAILTKTKPKAILVFNKQAFNFFEIDDKTRLGMDFCLTKTNIPNTFYCKEFDCIIYKSRFLNHFVKKEEMERIKNEVELVLNTLV